MRRVRRNTFVEFEEAKMSPLIFTAFLQNHVTLDFDIDKDADIDSEAALEEELAKITKFCEANTRELWSTRTVNIWWQDGGHIDVFFELAQDMSDFLKHFAVMEKLAS